MVRGGTHFKPRNTSKAGLVMKMIIDRSLLMVVAVGCALLAWLFWSSLGNRAFEVFGVVFVVYLLVENHLLRQHIKRATHLSKE